MQKVKESKKKKKEKEKEKNLRQSGRNRVWDILQYEAIRSFL